MMRLRLRRLGLGAAAALLIAAPVALGAAGDRDESFGTHGTVSLGSVSSVQAYGVAPAPDGGVAIAAQAPDTSGQPAFAVERLTASGAFDEGFGRGGVVTTAFPDTSYAFAERVAFVGTKVLAVGQASPTSGSSFPLLLARYGANGSLDTTFGTGGRAVPALPDLEPAFAFRGLATGSGGAFFVSLLARRVSDGEYVIAVAKFTTAGALDTAFGTGGVGMVAAAGGGGDLALDGTGRAVVSGSFAPTPGQPGEPGVARFTTAGVPDAAFGTGGVAIPTTSVTVTEVHGVATQGEKVLLAGAADRPDDSAEGVALMRLTATGEPDASFGGGDGLTVAPWGYRPLGVDVLRPDGRALVYACERIGTDSQLLGFDAAGAIDSTWGFGGQALGVRTEASSSCPGSAALLPDGRTITAAQNLVGRLRSDVNGLPGVSISAPAGQARQHAPFPLTATASDPDGRLLSVVWDLDGDGAYDDGFGTSVTARFETTGTARPAVRVTDDDGAQATAQRSVTVVGNQPAIASFTADPMSPLTGDTVTFDPAASSDPDGSIVRYEWDLDGDGGFEDSQTEPVTRTATFPRAGTVTVSLRVTAADGTVATATRDLLVRSHPPTVTLGDRDAESGVPVPFTASVFDADGDAIAEIAWDLDDDGEFDDGTGLNAAPVFRRLGEHVIHVRATDDGGASGQADATVTVRNRAPVAAVTIAPAVPTYGADTVLDASASRDFDGTIARYDWDLDGDGTYESGGTSPRLTHRFTRTGHQGITLKVIDDAGAEATTFFDLLVANAVPGASFEVSPAAPRAGSPVTLDASASTDPGGEQIVSYRWDVDGTGGADIAGGPVVSYTFPRAGTYPVTLKVRDADGATATATRTVVVGGAAGFALNWRAAVVAPRVGAPAGVRSAALRRGLPVRLRFAHRFHATLALYDGSRRIARRSLRLPAGRSVTRLAVGRAARAHLGRRGHRALTLRVRTGGALTARTITVTRG